MKVAILADFPPHVIPEFGKKFFPREHFATWLPQVAEAFGSFPDLEAHWITLSNLLDEPKEVRWQGQTFHVLPTAKSGRALTLFAKDRKAIQARIAAIQPDLVHGWGSEDVYALAAATSGRTNIVSMQGILSHLVLQNILQNRMSPRVYFQALVEFYVLRKADCITTESVWGRDVILRRNPRARVELVEYGVQNHFLETSWQPNPQKPAAIFVGSIVPLKGIQDAVAAFRSPALAHAELWVAGSGGPWAAKLQAEAPSNVRWLGRVSTMEIAQLLSQAWCLILPTRADTSPNVVKEARVIGLPVISTRCGGQITYIQHGENGFLVEPEDVDSLIRVASELLGNLNTAKAFGACHHHEHRAMLHPMETARKLHRLYLEMLESTSSL